MYQILSLISEGWLTWQELRFCVIFCSIFLSFTVCTHTRFKFASKNCCLWICWRWLEIEYFVPLASCAFSNSSSSRWRRGRRRRRGEAQSQGQAGRREPSLRVHQIRLDCIRQLWCNAVKVQTCFALAIPKKSWCGCGSNQDQLCYVETCFSIKKNIETLWFCFEIFLSMNLLKLR